MSVWLPSSWVVRERVVMVNPHWSVEVKHRKKLPDWIHSAMMQAEVEADGRVPIVVLHEKNLKYEDSYVMIRINNFNAEMNDAKTDDD